MLIVILSPFLNNGPGVRESHKPVFVEALVAKLTIEAFDVRILRRLARLDQFQLYPVGVRPLV